MKSKKILLIVWFTILSINIFCQNIEGIEKGFESSQKVIELIKDKEYNAIRSSFLSQIGKSIPDNMLMKYTNQGAELIKEYGMPDKDFVNKRLMMTKVNDKTIINEESTIVIYFDYPFPAPSEKGQPAERMISIGYIQALGFNKIVALQVIDNTKRPIIKPSFAKLEKLDFNIDDISRYRIRYSGGNVDPEASNTVTGDINELKSNEKIYNQSKKVLELLKDAKIARHEPIKDMPRHNGKPEMIIFQLNFDPNFMAPPEMLKKPHIMVLLILNEETGKSEKNIDWIEIRQFSGMNIGYKYFVSVKEHNELYNQIADFKELIK